VVQRVGRRIALLLHDLGTRRGYVVSSTPRLQFTPGKRPGTHCTGGWVGPRAGLDNIVKKVLVYSSESVHKQWVHNLPTTYRHDAATSPTTFFFEFWWISPTNCMIYTEINGKFICSNCKFEF
jgi:hypothetical protein